MDDANLESLMNIRMIALDAGDALKYVTSANEVDRTGSGIFPFPRDDFPNDAITSVRAKRVYDWIMSLGRHACTEVMRASLLEKFLFRLAPDGALNSLEHAVAASPDFRLWHSTPNAQIYELVAAPGAGSPSR